jgi:type II secretory pathway pseudopilin PulG
MPAFSNSKGFSLVEILVGIGLLGALVYLGMNTMKMQSKLTKTIEVKNEQESVFKDITQILSSSNSCKQSFQNWLADPPSSALQAATIYYMDDTGSVPQIRYVANPDPKVAKKYGNNTTKLLGVRIQSDASNNIPPGQLKGSTNLFIKFDFGEDKVKGSSTIERKIPLRVEIDNLTSRKIVDCSSSGLTSALDNMYLKLAGGTMRGDIIMKEGAAIYFMSDKHLKYDVRSLPLSLPKIINLTPTRYVWRDSLTEDFGFLAQEVHSVLPHLVTEDEAGLLKVNYVQIMPTAIKSVQELDDDNQRIKNKLDKMKNDMDEINRILEGKK